MADHRPDIYREGDRLIFRASSLNFCDKRLVAGALGHEPLPPPETLQRAWDEGAVNEDRVLAMWRDGVKVEGPYAAANMHEDGTLPQWFGLDPKQGGSYKPHRDASEGLPYTSLAILDDDQFTVELPMGTRDGVELVLRGHMDGMAQCFSTSTSSAIGTGDRVVEEAKLLGPDYYRKWLKDGWAAFPYYAMQVSVYHYATGLPVAFIVGQKVRVEGDERAEAVQIPNVHVTMWGDDDQPVPVKIGAVKARVWKLAGAVLAGELPACTSSDWPCPFTYLHDDDDEAAGKTRKAKAKADAGVKAVRLSASDQAKMARLVEQYTEWTDDEKVLKANKTAAKDDMAAVLKPYREDREKVTVDLGDVNVEWIVKHQEAGPATVMRRESWSEYPKITQAKDK